MKKSLLNTLVRLPELAAAFAIIISLIGVTAAAEVPSGKGLARLLTKPATTTAANASRPTNCSTCTDVYVQKPDAAARGANRVQAAVIRHGCGGCSTTIASLGVGKAKRDVATHRCSVSSAKAETSCCGTQSASGMTGCVQN
ncbi:MAG TPA: hypothetical protein VHI52_07690 [Verrucomicrobiae bacterium]|nr:hypothetical protein [Verrucomicrobiae bacterium]